MKFWNEQVDQLEDALRGNTSALMLHFLRTSSSQALMSVAGDSLAGISENTRASITAALIARLEQPKHKA